MWPERLSVHGAEVTQWAESHSGDAQLEINWLAPNPSLVSICSFHHCCLDGHGNLLISLFLCWSVVKNSLQLGIFNWLMYLADDLNVNCGAALWGLSLLFIYTPEVNYHFFFGRIVLPYSILTKFCITVSGKTETNSLVGPKPTECICSKPYWEICSLWSKALAAASAWQALCVLCATQDFPCTCPPLESWVQYKHPVLPGVLAHFRAVLQQTCLADKALGSSPRSALSANMAISVVLKYLILGLAMKTCSLM